MSNTIKVTVIAGAKNGFEMSFDCSKSVLVGRSRSADLRLPEPDVSGKHFEFVKTDAGCMVKVRSRNGLVVDGRTLQCDDTTPVQAGSVIDVGTIAKVRVDEILFGMDSVGASDSSSASSDGVISSADNAPATDDAEAAVLGETAGEPLPGDAGASDGANRLDLDADTASDPMPNAMPDPPAPAPVGEDLPGGAPQDVLRTSLDGVAFTDDATEAEPDDSLTSAGEDGETQEMKTRVGSLDEIIERKRQLDRARTSRRFRVGFMIVLLVASLAGVWLFLNWSSHVIDIMGPYLPNGDFDEAVTTLLNEEGSPEFFLRYPRNDAMKVLFSSDSNSVEVASWFGKKSDIPFHLEFIRWNDRTDLQRSLEESFERWMMDEAAKGSAFEPLGRPVGEFLEDEFPTWIESETLRGVRFVRAEYTRSRDHELWHGNCFYFRKGDRIHLLRLEIPDLFWKLAKRRVTKELHLAFYATFSDTHWDSPGASVLLDAKLSDDELIGRIKRELSANSVGSWPDLAAYIDTLLVRSWGDKPRIQKEAMSFYLQMQEHMTRFYLERELALRTARANGNEKRMNSIRMDCKTAFGALPRDRRLAMVNNPEVWSCRPRRRRSR